MSASQSIYRRLSPDTWAILLALLLAALVRFNVIHRVTW